MAVGARAAGLSRSSRAAPAAERSGKVAAQGGACGGLVALEGGGADVPPVPTPGAMHHEPHRRPQPTAQRTRRPERGAPRLDGDGRSQARRSVTRSDHRHRLCRLQSTSGLASLCEPRLGTCPPSARLGGAGAQSAHGASCLKPAAKCTGDPSSARTNSSIQPDALNRWWQRTVKGGCVPASATWRQCSASQRSSWSIARLSKSF